MNYDKLVLQIIKQGERTFSMTYSRPEIKYSSDVSTLTIEDAKKRFTKDEKPFPDSTE